MVFEGMQGRDDAINYISSSICIGEFKDFLLLGKKGSGKKYISNKIIKELLTFEDLAIFKAVGDEFIDLTRYTATRKMKINFTINLSTFFSISVTAEEKSKTKTNYLIEMLRKISERKIIFLINDWESVDIKIQEFISYLINEKKFFEQTTDKEIYFIISDFNYKSLFSYFESIVLKDYNREDVEKYIQSIYPMKSENAKKIFEICGSNLDLVKMYIKEIEHMDIVSIETLEKLIKIKLELCKKRGEEKEIKTEEIENIIVTSAFCLQSFSYKEIEFITKISPKIISDSFLISVNENIFKYEKDNEYDFVSSELKKAFATLFKNNNFIYLSYYKYLSATKPSEYFQRAYYLIKYHSSITPNSASLLVLALLVDNLSTWDFLYEEIVNLIYSYGINYLPLFQKIKIIYKEKTQWQFVDNLIKSCNLSLLNLVGKAAITRYQFQNLYMHNEKTSLEYVYNKLLFYMQQPLVINEENIDKQEELFLKVKIIYSIMPYVLDDRNDIEKFNLLYNQSNLICRQLEYLPYKTNGLEYIKNIFNRKAFLFAHPRATEVYYEEAENYFKKNEIWDQYLMTIISHAGTLLACGEYEKSVQLSETAQNLIKTRKIFLKTPEKMLNNYYIGKFLYFEYNAIDFISIQHLALQLIVELESILPSERCATRHVILTNIASLQLYCDKFEDYFTTKKIIEESLGCDDVSDIFDDSINDFYRYHFAWFQIYYEQRFEKWAECKEHIMQLESFVPALFKKFEKNLQPKIKYFKNKIFSCTKLNSAEYCIWRKINTSSTFLDRGLPLSDLQYTSND